MIEMATGDSEGVERRPIWVHAAFMSVIALLLLLLFHWLGNTVESVGSRSVFRWMVARWSDTVSFGADYSVGWFVPPISLFVVWRRRRDLARVAQRVNVWGLPLIVLALVLHWLGARIQQPRLSLVGLVLLLWGLPLFIFGWGLARQIIFPCAYLLFCIPWNFLNGLTFPLRLFSSAVAAWLLNGLGIAVMRSGTVIRALYEQGIDFNVADPCSGLNSILAMMALTALYANFTQKSLVRQWALFACAVPLAMAGNIFRICTVAVFGRLVGREFALTLYHDYSGLLVFPVAILLMVALGGLIRSAGREHSDDG